MNQGCRVGGRRQQLRYRLPDRQGYYTEKRDSPFDAAIDPWGDYITSYHQPPAVYARFWTAHQWICANPRGQTPDWCDECGVNSAGCAQHRPIPDGWVARLFAYAADTGSTMRQMINAGTPNNLSDHVWLREFTNALVIVNPTTSTQWATVPAGGWNKSAALTRRTTAARQYQAA